MITIDWQNLSMYNQEDYTRVKIRALWRDRFFVPLGINLYMSHVYLFKIVYTVTRKNISVLI